ncbi:oligosaccharide flippase family protein [bacterium]|nr:oligosaccharide flippase family protein [bacterium]
MKFSAHIDKSIWLTLDRGLFALYGLLFNLILIRHLPTAEYTYYVLVYQSLFMFLVALCSSFALQPMMKYAAGNKDVASFISIGIIMYSLAALLLTIMCLASTPWIDQWFKLDGLGKRVWYIPWFFLAFSLRLIFQYIFQSTYRLKEIFLTNLVFSVISLSWLFLWIFVSYEYNAEDVFMNIGLSSIVATIVSVVYGWNTFKFSLRQSVDQWRQMLSFGTYGTANTSSFFIFGYLDNYLIAFFSTPFQVNIYNVARIFYRVFDVFAQIVQGLLIPTVSKLHTQLDYITLRQVFEKAVCFSSIALLPVFFIYLFFADVLFGIMFGLKYQEGISILYIFSFHALIVPWTSVAGSYYVGIDKMKIALMINSAYIGLSLLFYFILIPSYQAKGAALAVLFSTIVATFIHVVVIHKLIRFSFLGIISRIHDILNFCKTTILNIKT